MQNKMTKRFLCWIVIVGLVFSMGSFSFAKDDAAVNPDSYSTADLSLENDAAPAVQAEEIASNPLMASANKLDIKSVEVLNGGSTQIMYRDSVYRGIAANGEDPAKYYTTKREINLKDPRIFNIEFKVPASIVGSDPNAFLASVNFTYGGFPLSAWGNGNSLRGTTAIMLNPSKSIRLEGDSYTVSAEIRFNSPWASSNQGTNIPFNGYYAGTQGNFNITGSTQSGDNRDWWMAGPAYKGTGTYELAAIAGAEKLAGADLHIGPYDSHRSWIEMNEFAQSLIEAINGEQFPIAELDKKPIGLIAAGYVAKNADGKYVKGNRATDVYVEVGVMGYGLTDNYETVPYSSTVLANNTFNNYSRYNAQWNIVVAKDFDKVDKYLNETVPMMNDNPQVLIDKYKDADPKDIDIMQAFYQNNTHADEVTGTESCIDLIDQLIDGGKAGKIIKYKAMEDKDIVYGYLEGDKGDGAMHRVAGNWTGRFTASDSRKSATFDTGEALDYFIFVNSLCSNPDGKAGMRRVNRYGLDMNRDVVFSTQAETISLTKDIAKWDPMVLNEWHGYVAQMLIEPCTAPHAPTFEYDLLQNNMIELAYESGRAIVGSTGYNQFRVPWDHQGGGDWDDGGTIYAPMFAMLFGTYGYTVEFPYSNTDAFEAGNVLNYAMINSLIHGNTAYYNGNALNRALPDLEGVLRDSHVVDNKYASMRKSSVMNKLEYKLRGIENIDSMAADKYFIDNRRGPWEVVGRSRLDSPKGGKLNYFPDYIIIPTDPSQQYNPAEGINVLNHIIERGAKVSVSTEAVVYDGVKYAAGTYVIDMRQGRRNFIFEVMGKGYDATGFPSMYADIYANFPDVRGFDSVQAWNEVSGGDVFARKLKQVDSVEKKIEIAGKPADYVIFKSQNVDAVRFVNLLLSGKSSGPSYSEKGSVWMLRKNLEGVANGAVGTKSDYVIKASDLYKVNNLVKNPDLALRGAHIIGKYVEELPKEAVQLVEPVIQFNTTRTAQTGGVLWWALNDYLGFASMAVDTGYHGSSTLRPGANVVVSNNAAPSAAILTAVKADKLGLVLIQNASVLTDANFGSGNAAPTTGSFQDIAVNGTYNINDSLFTANYEVSTTLYGRGNYYTGNLPAGSKELFRSLPNGEDAFIGGFQPTKGDKSTFGNRLLAFSTILKGGGIVGKPVQSLTIGQNMSNRSHYQKLYPMLATAIFAGAAGILDDQLDPIITGVNFSGANATVVATDANSTDSGLAGKYALYLWDAAAKKYAVKSENASGTFALVNGNRYLAGAFDWAGNEAIEKFAYLEGVGFIYDSEKAAPSAVVEKINGNKNNLTVTVNETFYKDGELVFTRDLTKTFSIDNNAADTYEVEGYKVYVDTKGNVQIRDCRITSFVAQ